MSGAHPTTVFRRISGLLPSTPIRRRRTSVDRRKRTRGKWRLWWQIWGRAIERVARGLAPSAPSPLALRRERLPLLGEALHRPRTDTDSSSRQLRGSSKWLWRYYLCAHPPHFRINDTRASRSRTPCRRSNSSAATLLLLHHAHTLRTPRQAFVSPPPPRASPLAVCHALEEHAVGG